MLEISLRDHSGTQIIINLGQMSSVKHTVVVSTENSLLGGKGRGHVDCLVENRWMLYATDGKENGYSVDFQRDSIRGITDK